MGLLETGVEGMFIDHGNILAHVATTPAGQAETAARLASLAEGRERREHAAEYAKAVVAAELAATTAPSFPAAGESYLA